MLGIWFSAVYSSHHYIMDVLAGIVLAIVGLFTFEKLTKKPKIQYQIANFSQII